MRSYAYILNFLIHEGYITDGICNFVHCTRPQVQNTSDFATHSVKMENWLNLEMTRIAPLDSLLETASIELVRLSSFDFFLELLLLVTSVSNLTFTVCFL